MTESDLPNRRVVTETTLPPMKTFGTAPAPKAVMQSNADLAQDFLDLSFALESGRPLPVFTRFEGPITLRLTGAPQPTLQTDLQLLMARLQREAGVEITLTAQQSANITIEAVPRSAIKRVLPQAACFVAPNVTSLREYRQERRNKTTNWTLLKQRTTVAIFVPNDVSPQEARDCLHEELAQALGPLNDLYRLPNSVFNDDNVHTVLTDFDMLMLRITYAPEIGSGMTRDAVADQLPVILARFNPAGRRAVQTTTDPTPRDWIEAIQAALGPDTSPANRRIASENAVAIAKKRGWTDHRRGFSHYARARILQGEDPVAAVAEYRRADGFYSQSTQTRLHQAYVATQLAAYALAAGQPEVAIARIDPHTKAAADAQNAALLSTLQLLQAEALDGMGRTDEARTLRLDSLGWARYGFGEEWVVRSKLREIAALGTHTPPV
ncbi:MAG: DUF2927 domain-containing protein [Pseudomonadota bacterium]